MIDMTKTIQPRSDQYNADDLISGPKTIKITNVRTSDNQQQPIHIDYEDGEGKPWKPCLSMRRILVIAWGGDGSAYIGRSVTLYRDPTVKYGGAEQGGIRISHLSHIERTIRTMLTITRGKRAPYTVEPLQLTEGPALSAEHAELWKAQIDRATNMAELSDTAAKIKSNNYAESAGKAELMSHYQAKVAAIREPVAEPAETAAEVDPSKMDYPPEEAEASESLEGEIPKL